MKVSRTVSLFLGMALIITSLSTIYVTVPWPSDEPVVHAQQVSDQADIIFIMDESGSMQPAQQQVRERVADIVRQLGQKGIDYRLGLVGFGGLFVNGNRPLLRQSLTGSADQFVRALNNLQSYGSDERGLDATVLAMNPAMGFRDNAGACAILITDDESNGDKSTQDDAIYALNQRHPNTTVFLGITKNRGASRAQYGPATGSLAQSTNGAIYDIDEFVQDSAPVMADIMDKCVKAVVLPNTPTPMPTRTPTNTPPPTNTATLTPTPNPYLCSRERVAMTGIGIGPTSTTPITITVPAAPWARLQTAGGGFLQAAPKRVEVTTDQGTIQLDEPTLLLNKSPLIEPQGMVGYSFETAIPTDQRVGITVVNDDAQHAMTGALIVYHGVPAPVNDPVARYSSAFASTMQYAWGGDDEPPAPDRHYFVGPAQLTLNLPRPIVAPATVVVQVAVMDKNEQSDRDRRIAIVRAEAGTVVAERTLTNPDSPEMTVVNLTLPNVPAGTQQVLITLDSPRNVGSQWYKDGAGDSVFLLGATAWHECPRPTPTPTLTNTPTPTNTVPPTLTPTPGTPTITPTPSPTLSPSPTLPPATSWSATLGANSEWSCGGTGNTTGNRPVACITGEQWITMKSSISLLPAGRTAWLKTVWRVDEPSPAVCPPNVPNCGSGVVEWTQITSNSFGQASFEINAWWPGVAQSDAAARVYFAISVSDRENGTLIRSGNGENEVSIDLVWDPKRCPLLSSSASIGTSGGTLQHTNTDGSNILVNLPAGAVPTPIELVYTSQKAFAAPSFARFQLAGQHFRLEAYQNDVRQEHFQFSVPVQVTLSYPAGSSPSNLQLLYYNVANKQWENAASGPIVNNGNGTVTIPINHLTEFALVESTEEATAPVETDEPVVVPPAETEELVEEPVVETSEPVAVPTVTTDEKTDQGEETAPATPAPTEEEASEDATTTEPTPSAVPPSPVKTTVTVDVDETTVPVETVETAIPAMDDSTDGESLISPDQSWHIYLPVVITH